MAKDFRVMISTSRGLQWVRQDRQIRRNEACGPIRDGPIGPLTDKWVGANVVFFLRLVAQPTGLILGGLGRLKWVGLAQCEQT